MAKTKETEQPATSATTAAPEAKAPPPQAKGGQPIAKGMVVTISCEVVDILQGEYVEVKPEGGTPFMIKAQHLNA